MSNLYIVMAVLAFSLLVIMHELGHFTLAKINKVKVEEFSVGMGPKIVGIKGKETVYTIRLFPIGGFVKMLGDDEKSSDLRAFNNKSPLRKLSIVVAGPLMNILLAAILFGTVGSINGFLEPTVSKILEKSPAASLDIKPGDRLVKVNGSKLFTWQDFQFEVAMSKGNDIDITINRGTTTKNITVKPVIDKETGSYMVGLYPTVVEKPSFASSVAYGARETISMVKEAYMSLGIMISGKASAKDVGGPLSIIKVTGKVAEAGIIPLLSFTAFLSTQLGVLNLLPIPALDGGYVMLFLFQIITGKEVDDNKVGIINTIGFTLLMALMVLVTIKDILYPIKI
ncbi:MAG: RIP metalloprotease RseP [Bacillota bacterium]|nr:RIP metalloprotease RseP [Bacillota bacterium]